MSSRSSFGGFGLDDRSAVPPKGIFVFLLKQSSVVVVPGSSPLSLLPLSLVVDGILMIPNPFAKFTIDMSKEGSCV